MQLKGKNVLVVGLGRSGVAATQFLVEQGARVAVTDLKQEEALGEAVQKLRSLPLEWHLGGSPAEIFEKRDLICLSPGVPPSLPALVWAKRKRVPILGEMGLAVLFLKDRWVAVTGTNGKSTTVTLIAQMLKEGGQKVALAGNIGRPLLDVVMEGKRWDCLVVEVSSFQLETVKKFRPWIAVVLNVTEDHLDRYSSFHEYVQAKMRILKEQKSRDWVVYNREDPHVQKYVQRSHAKKVPFSIRRKLSSGLFCSGGRVIRRWEGAFENYPLDHFPLSGPHNTENLMASIGTARICEVPPASICRTLQNFQGLPHRLEKVSGPQGILCFDDSKATNFDATRRSLEGFADGRVILIGGGRYKGGDFQKLREIVSKKVKCLLLIGEAETRFAEAFEGSVPCLKVGDLEKAVMTAFEKAVPGDVVLLSPACASLDQFRNFEERGEKFKEFVKRFAA